MFKNKKGNISLSHKIVVIDKNSPEKFLKSTSPIITYQTKKKNLLFKNGLMSLHKEKTNFFKKIINEEPEYRHDKFEQKFLESRKYEKDSCHFPTISFSNTNRTSKTPFSKSYNFRIRKFKTINTEENLPKILNNKSRSNFTSLQTKYYIKNKFLEQYFKKSSLIHKNKTLNKDKKVHKKKSMISVTEKDEDEISSLNKINIDKNIDNESNSEKKSINNSRSKNEDDSEKRSGSESLSENSD